ncbi:MAG: hypothetical protein ABI466_00565, partial [Chloroflexota bacterium]
PLLACESRVIVTRSPSPQAATPSGAIAPSPSVTADPTPAKVALRPTTGITPAARLLSYERASDIPRIVPQFVLTDDGRVITVDASGEFMQRKLTPSGTAAMVLQAIETGLFDRDASHGRVLRPGPPPLGRGATIFIVVVANGAREIRVTFEPTGQPDDSMYEPSATRARLTALVRGYEDLAWVPATHWVESRQQPYRPAAHRLFLQIEPNVKPSGSPTDAETVWPFFTAIESVGDLVNGPAAPWRCAVIVDDDARALAESLTRAGAITRYGPGSPSAQTDLTWRGSGTLRLQLSPLLPHEPLTCVGAPTPL